MAAYTTIDNPELYFQCKLFTGNGSNGNAKTFDGDEDMQPNVVWIKSRSAAENQHIFDSIRGANKRLLTNTTGTEFDDSSNLQSFDSNGFTLGTADGINKNNATFVAWCWKESATAGFDIVTYTGDGSARTISHSLSAKPNFFVVKSRTFGEQWECYHEKIGAEKCLQWDDNSGEADILGRFNDTEPTTSVFTVGDADAVNKNTYTYVTYLWTDIQGYSKFGSYTGNGQNDGSFVYLGFRPAFVILKGNSSNREWIMHDNKRDPNNVVDGTLYVNTNDTEGTGTDRVDFLSNGFKIKENGNNWNASGETYVYLAWAEQPFVNSNGVPGNAR